MTSAPPDRPYDMTTIDLGPAAERMAQLLAGVEDDRLTATTPCPAYSLGDLIDHVGGLALAFTAAATKTTIGDATQQGPSGDASRLGDDWRTRIPNDLETLAEVWRDDTAWTGMTQAGGIDLPGEIAGLVALDELVVHGWDVAVASGQPYEPSDEELRAVLGFVEQFDSGDGEDNGLFGPFVDVPAEAPLLHRVLGRTGRDPQWRPAAT